MPIVIVGMLDEREGALKVIKDQIEMRGHKTILIDISIGTGGIVSSLKADVTCSEVVELAGGTIEKVKALLVTERDRAISMMVEGLAKKLMELHGTRQLEGVIAIAGMTGTFVSLTAMNSLPFGVPKLLISSVVAMPAYANWVAQYFGLRDITVMNTVVDTVGMNRPVKTLALNGANAIAGMVEGAARFLEERRPSLVITEFDFCDEGAHYVRHLLKEEYEMVSFHAQGIGDRAASDLVSQGFFQGFIDLVPASFSEYLLGGNRASGPNRLDVAQGVPIPYILSPCGFDMISCGPIERKDSGDYLWESRKLAERKIFLQDAVRVQARTSADEMRQVARAVAEKLNRYKYKMMVKFVIPRKGFSALSVEGAALYDPASDEAFIGTLKQHLDAGIKVFEVDTDVNNREFARTVVAALAEAMRAKPQLRWDKAWFHGWRGKP
ncbi:MAG: Tm-1-like ATP-binding domain-containing protein [Syntrophorhabdales bacterium]|jgi:uncharacterized protein (UPF0261 family)